MLHYLKYTLLLLISCIAICSCGRSYIKIRYLIPDSYEGPLLITYLKNGGESSTFEDDWLIYRFNNNGILKLNVKENKYNPSEEEYYYVKLDGSRYKMNQYYVGNFPNKWTTTKPKSDIGKNGLYVFWRSTNLHHCAITSYGYIARTKDVLTKLVNEYERYDRYSMSELIPFKIDLIYRYFTFKRLQLIFNHINYIHYAYTIQRLYT